MANGFAVMVNGHPVAVNTTEPNAVMLKNKINKMYVGNPASVSEELPYNPKHVDALDWLAVRAGELGLVPALVAA